MTSLYDAYLGAGAIVRQTRLGLVRRARHGDASFMVDSHGEVGVVLNLSASHRVERRMAGRTRSDMARVGSISVLPPGHPARFAITGSCRVLQLRLPWPPQAGDLAAGDAASGQVELRPSLNADDPVLARLIISAAVAEGGQAGAALQGIAAHLLEQHSARPEPSAKLAVGGLSPRRLRRALERIEADLGDTVPLAVLAAEAGMSAAHFAREFAREMGSPPHRYVVRRRLERAIQLLAHAHLPVAEVARRAGFTHASHLARHMHRLTGITPARLRNHVLP